MPVDAQRLLVNPRTLGDLVTERITAAHKATIQDALEELLALVQSLDSEDEQDLADLQAAVDALEAADAEFAADLAAEAAARAAADAALQANIDAEEAARVAGDDALDARLTDQEAIHTDAKEPTGFVHRNGDTTFTWDDSTRTLTVNPTGSTFEFYVQSQKFSLASASASWDDTEGIHFGVINPSGALEFTHISAFATEQEILEHILRDNAFVAEIYWDATNNISLRYDERHGLMPWETHYNLHTSEGTRYLDGLAIGDITADDTGNLDAHAQFSCTAGKILDEDRVDTPDAKALTGDIVILYQDGATGTWRWTTDSAPIVLDTGVPVWNENSGGTWLQTPVSNNDFFLAHVFASNELRYGGLIAVIGQATYNSKADARQGATTEIAGLVVQGLPSPEFVPVGTIIYQYKSASSNTWSAFIVSTDEGDDFVNWIGTTSFNSAGAPSDHGALAGLTDQDHPATAITYDNATSGLSATDVQGAIDETVALQNIDGGNFADAFTGTAPNVDGGSF